MLTTETPGSAPTRSDSPRSESPRSESPRSGPPRSGPPRSGPPRSGSLRFGTLLTAADLDAVADEWDALYERSPSATPFLAHGWLSAYWRAFGDRDALRIGWVRDGDRLVAAAPLRLRRRRGLSVLTPVADELTDFSDVLLDPAATGAGEVLAGWLLDLPGWDQVDLPEVGPGAAVWRMVEGWPGQFVSTPASTCLELPVDEPDALIATLPQKQRHNLRRELRRMDDLGLEVYTVPAEPAPLTDAVTELLDLHARQWAGRPVNELHLTDGFRAHLVEAARRLAPAGRLALTRYALNGSLAAVSLCLLTGDMVGGYLYGVEPELRAKVDIGALMIRSGLELGRATGASTFALLRGEEPGKLRWRPRARHNRRLVLLRPAGGRGHAAAASALLVRAGKERLRRSPLALRAADRLREHRAAR